MPRLPRTRPERATVGGLALIAVGSVLPWIRESPDGPHVLKYVPGLNTGLETFGLALLPLAVAGVAVLVWRPDRRRRFPVTGGVGAVALLAAGYQLLSYPPGFGAFRAGSGVYVTALGAVLALVASGRGYWVETD